MTATSSAVLTAGTKIWPISRSDVCSTRMRGRKPSCIAWLVIEYTPEITACDAITVAAVESTTIGSSAQSGKSLKNGFSIASGCAASSAPWPR